MIGTAANTGVFAARLFKEEQIPRRLTVVSAVIDAVAGFTLLPAMADTTSTPVLKTLLEGMPGTEANIVLFDIDPGWKTEHHHPGHVFVYVLEGAIHLEIDGQDPMDFSAE